MTKKDKTTRKAIGYGIGLMVIPRPECQAVSCKGGVAMSGAAKILKSLKFMIIFEYEISQEKRNSFGG